MGSFVFKRFVINSSSFRPCGEIFRKTVLKKIVAFNLYRSRLTIVQRSKIFRSIIQLQRFLHSLRCGRNDGNTYFIEFVKAQYLKPNTAFWNVLNFIGSFLYKEGITKLLNLTKILKNAFFML